MTEKGHILSQAIHLATNAHHGQFDRGKNPYILHPIAVMGLLGDGADEELQAIALLHDVVEDSKVTWKDLSEAGMTDRVIAAVRLLTKMPGQTMDEYKAGIFSSPDAMRVKMADLTHNSDLSRLKGVSDKDIARMRDYQVFYHEIKQELLRRPATA